MNKKQGYKYKGKYYESIEDLSQNSDYGIKMAHYIAELSGYKPDVELIPYNKLLWILMGWNLED